MNVRLDVIEVYERYLKEYGDGEYNAESFIDFITVVLTDYRHLKVRKPHDQRSLIRWFRDHADRLEKAMPR